MPKPKIFFLSTNNNGVVYYRSYAFAQKMSELGIAHSRMYPQWDGNVYESIFWESEFQKHIPTIQETMEWADLVVCQYVSTPMGLAVVQGIRDNRPCFMECDDYFGAVPAYNGAYSDNRPGDRQDYWGTRQLMESTGVITPTQYLADSFRKINPTVKIIPNCIDFNVWNHTEMTRRDKVNIGWVGGASHDGDLKLVKDALYKILNTFPNATVTIATCPPPNWEKRDRLNLVNLGVAISKYPDAVKRLGFDIGIAPLRDNYFNRGKSNLRYLEYSAMKIPTVASNVEPFKKNFVGLIANDEREWFDSLSLLINDRVSREKMGQDAYDNIYQNFNLETVSREYAGFAERVISA